MEIFKRVCFLVSLSFLLAPVYGQNLDSLMSRAKNLLIQKEYDSARVYYFDAMTLAEANDDWKNLAIIHNNVGLTYKTDVSSKIVHFNQSIFYHLENNDRQAAAEVSYNLGLALKKKGIYEEAIPQFQSALEVFVDHADTTNEAKTLDVIGNLYFAMGEYENSEKYHLKALDRFVLMQDEDRTARVWHNLAELYIAKRDIGQARKYLRMSWTLKEKLEKATISSRVLLGEIFMQEEVWDSAFYYYNSTLNERIEKGYTYDFPSAYYHLGDYYYQTGSMGQANDHFETASQWADSLEQNQLQIEILNKQIELDKRMNKFESSINRYEKLIRLKEKVAGERAAIRAAHLNAQFKVIEKEREVEKQNNQIALQKVENESLNFKYNLALIVIGIFLLMLILIIFLTIRVRRKNQLLNEQNETILALHSELRHRTKNYYQMLKGILWYDMDNQPNPKIKELIKRYITRVDSMAQIQHYLVPNDVANESGVQLNIYLSDLIDQIDIALNKSEPKVKMIKQLEIVTIDYTSASYVGIALNELLQNAFKHSFEGISEPEISICLYVRNDKIHLTALDNGVGMDEIDHFKNQSEGIKLISVLVERIEGTLSYNSEKGKGVKVELLIPTTTSN